MICPPAEILPLPFATLLAFTRNPGALLVIGAVITIYGLNLVKCGIQGDTLMPGTNFTYLPRWLFITTGLLMQIPLPAAIWYLQWVKTVP